MELRPPLPPHRCRRRRRWAGDSQGRRRRKEDDSFLEVDAFPTSLSCYNKRLELLDSGGAWAKITRGDGLERGKHNYFRWFLVKNRPNTKEYIHVFLWAGAPTGAWGPMAQVGPHEAPPLLLELCHHSYVIHLILISFSFDKPTFFQLLICLFFSHRGIAHAWHYIHTFSCLYGLEWATNTCILT